MHSATMVTAILPSLTDDNEAAATSPSKRSNNPRDSIALSLDSEATITPDNFQPLSGSLPVGEAADEEDVEPEKRGKPSALAGYVGLFTGCGALVALSLFLPLPTRFGQIKGVTLGEAVTYSFYVVGAIAFVVAVFVFFGLRGLKGEEGKGWSMLLGGLKGPNRVGTASESSGTPPRKVGSSIFRLHCVCFCFFLLG